MWVQFGIFSHRDVLALMMLSDSVSDCWAWLGLSGLPGAMEVLLTHISISVVFTIWRHFSVHQTLHSRLALPLQPLRLPLRWWSSDKAAGSQVSIHTNGECYISTIQVVWLSSLLQVFIKCSFSRRPLISQPQDTSYALSFLAFIVILHILCFTYFLLKVCLSPTRI